MPRNTRGRTTASIVTAARDLRLKMTPAEVILWEVLRERKCAGLKFRRQHPIGPYVLDFFCTEKMLAIELDGAVHDGPEQVQLDAERTEYLKEWGIRVLRIRNEDLRNMDCVIERITQFISLRKK